MNSDATPHFTVPENEEETANQFLATMIEAETAAFLLPFAVEGDATKCRQIAKR